MTLETDGTNTIYYTYDASGKLISMNLTNTTYPNGAEFYYIRNAQGDISGLYDDTGKVVVEYSYDTWGKLEGIDGTLANTVGVINPYRYRCYRYDSEAGIYYLQSRYYNPEIGRFINADVLLSGIGESVLGCNTFSYCINNPVNMYDPTGFRQAMYATSTAWPYAKKSYQPSVRTSETSYKNVRSNRNPVKFKKKDKDITLVFGVNLTICNIIRISLSPGIACDNNTGVALVNTIAGGTGTPNTGGSLYITMTDAKYVEDLAGTSNQVGGSFPLYGTSVGLELVSPENAGYIGGTLFVGYSVAPVEGYGELANSYEFKHRD